MRRQFRYVAVISLTLLTASCTAPPNTNHNGPALGTSPPIPATTPSVTDNSGVPTNAEPIALVSTTFDGTKGTDHVACNAIKTEMLISADGGGIRWTATASATKTSSFPYIGPPLPNVVLQPSSGVLDAGKSQVLHISGTYSGGSGSAFYVAVVAPRIIQNVESASTQLLFCV